MLLPAMTHEWLVPFHPISREWKGKQDLNQYFSNGREIESTPEASDNRCLRPFCLPKDLTKNASARRQPAATPLRKAESLIPLGLLKETRSQSTKQGGKKRKSLQASLSPFSVAVSSWEPCAPHVSAQWWCQQLWWVSAGLGFSFLSLSSWFQFCGAPGWGILLLPPADQSTERQSEHQWRPSKARGPSTDISSALGHPGNAEKLPCLISCRALGFVEPVIFHSLILHPWQGQSTNWQLLCDNNPSAASTSDQSLLQTRESRAQTGKKVQIDCSCKCSAVKNWLPSPDTACRT